MPFEDIPMLDLTRHWTLFEAGWCAGVPHKNYHHSKKLLDPAPWKWPSENTLAGLWSSSLQLSCFIGHLENGSVVRVAASLTESSKVPRTLHERNGSCFPIMDQTRGVGKEVCETLTNV